MGRHGGKVDLTASRKKTASPARTNSAAGFGFHVFLSSFSELRGEWLHELHEPVPGKKVKA
jgi:hypothetical protein